MTHLPTPLLLDCYVCGRNWWGGISRGSRTRWLDPNKIQISASVGISPITSKRDEVSVVARRSFRLVSVIIVDDYTVVMGDPLHSIRPISGDLNDLIIERLKHRPSCEGIAAGDHPSVFAGHGKMILLGGVVP